MTDSQDYRGPRSIAEWIADIDRRASNADALWRQDGAPTIDACSTPAGSSAFWAMMAFHRLAKDMREGLAAGQVDDLAYAAHKPFEAPSFQQRVAPWMQECFGPTISADTLERNDRFIEEALELVQSLGYTADRAHALVDYVFGRPVGDPPQEVGGVMVTLAALCLASSLDMHAAGEVELDRINQPAIIEKIRAKQAAKPTGSALPIAVSGEANG